MDKLKKDVIEIIKSDALLDNATIGAMLGQPEEIVADARAELERDGVIMKYIPALNTELMDQDFVEALIELKVTPQRDLGYNDIARKVSKFPAVKSVYLMSGAYDLAVFVEAKTMREISAFVWEKLAVLDGVSSTCTLFIMRKYKANGLMLREEDTDERLVISP